MIRDEVVDLAGGDDELLFADGFDDCLLGVVEVFHNTVALYDKDMVITALVREGMTEDEAYEWFNFNIVGAYVGEKTPAFATIPQRRSI